MKLANIDGRAVLVTDDGFVDIASASAGAFGPDLQDVLSRWAEFEALAATSRDSWVATPATDPTWGPVVPRPGQVFAIGLNYRLHAIEAGLPLPEVPLVFTKFPSSIAAPYGTLELPTDRVDWEVEVALVIGREASRVPRADAWDHVAGVTAAQDFSARDVQLLGGAKPQFSLGKSFAGFTPLGPILATVDELEDRDAIDLECRINGVTLQKSSTSDLIFDVASSISYLSHIVTLRPGDVILTGTPSGVGLGFDPPRFLTPGDEVVTVVAGIGEMVHRCVAGPVFDPAEILG